MADIPTIISELKEGFEFVSSAALDELRKIRTGKASPSLVEDLDILTYNGTMRMRLRELASISVDGPAMIVVSPFDPSTIQDIEKGIHASPLQLSARVDDKIIRISTPALTEEQRIAYTKLASQKIEDSKNALRREREDARRKVKNAFDDKAIGEDDKFRAEKDIDELTKTSTEALEDLKKKKHDEIMSI